jgi:hypothetical protein
MVLFLQRSQGSEEIAAAAAVFGECVELCSKLLHKWLRPRGYSQKQYLFGTVFVGVDASAVGCAG